MGGRRSFWLTSSRIALFVRAIVASLLASAMVMLPVDSAAAAGPSLNWVALGDSYSAGVGLGSVSPGCDRDDHAYAPRAARDILSSSYSISQLFVACSGHGTSDLRTYQLDRVSASHDVASLTVGGNDIGFGAKVAGCYFECGPDTMSLQADVPGGTRTWDDVHDNLVTTYVNVRRRMNASGRLYVLTYPIPFARQTLDSCQGLTATEQNAANALVTRLDDTIWHAVRRANELLATVHGRPGNVHFVDWRTGTRVEDGYTIPPGYAGAGQKFATYVSPDGLCNTSGHTPYLNGYVNNPLTNPDRFNSFHPNSTGYWAAARLVAEGIRSGFGNPFGWLDEVSSPAPGQVSVRGWAADPSAPTQPLAVHVYSGATFLGALPANQHRPDVGAVFPGYGDHHGYSGTLDAPAGNLTICAVAINVGTGDNVPNGCRAVTVASPNPFGSLDEVSSPEPGQVRVRGWVADPNAPTQPLAVHVYSGATFLGALPANQHRPDVGAFFPGYGDYHGYSGILQAPAGNLTVCVVGINVGPGRNVPNGCRAVTVASTSA